MAFSQRLILIASAASLLFLSGCSGGSSTLIRNVQERGIWSALGVLALAIIGFIAMMGLMALERKYRVLTALGLRNLLLRIPVIGPQLNAGLRLQASVAKGKGIKRQLKQDIANHKEAKKQTAASEEGEAEETVRPPEPIVTPIAAAAPQPVPSTPAEPAALAQPAGFRPPLSRLPVPAEFITAAHLLNRADEQTVVGKRLGRYQVEAQHRQYELGVSYHAFDLKLNRPVCLTVLSPELTAAEASQIALLERVRLCAQLDHPNLTDIYDFELAEGHLFVVSEPIQGLPLLTAYQQWRAAGQPIGYADILQLVEQLLEALQYGESRGLHHGNLSPEQIYLEQRPGQPAIGTSTVKIHNFALWPRPKMQVEAPCYHPPEEITEATAAGDLFAVGTLLYHLMTGQAVDHQPELNDSKLTPPAELRPGIPVDIEEILLDCLALEPAQRPASISALAALCREITLSLGDKLMEEVAIAAGEPVIRVQAAGEQDRFLRLERDSYYFGQDSHNDLLLPGHGVAAVHARLDRGPTGWEISDLGSSQGTRLSDARLLPNLPEAWLPGQTLFIGPYQLDLTLANEAEAEPESDRVTSIGAALAPAQMTVMPGERVDFQLSLVNQGNRVDHFSLTIEGVPEAWTTVSTEQTELMPGAKGYILVTIAPPRSAEAAAADYPLSILVHSAADPAQRKLVTGLLTVAEFEHLQFELYPEHLHNRGDAVVTVANQGNRAVALNLIGKDSEAALGFEVSAQENWTLPAGATGAYPISIAAYQRPFFGTQRRIPFDINISANSSRHFLPGQLMITPRFPSWMLAASGMALAFICLVLGFVGNLLLINRPAALAAEVPPTATALATTEALGTASANSRFPASCAAIRQQNGIENAADGEYMLYVAGDEERPVEIYCHNMARFPTEYLTLDASTDGDNYSTISYPAQELRTTYQRVRLDLEGLRIDPTDRTFAIMSGTLPENSERVINDFGSAIGCSEATEAAVTGSANINLSGTPFTLAESFTYSFAGPEAAGAAAFSVDRVAATVTVSGNCGWALPVGGIPLTYGGVDQP